MHTMCFDLFTPTLPCNFFSWSAYTSLPIPNFISSFSFITYHAWFVFPVYSWMWNHLLECGLPPRGHSLKKTDFSPPRSHQLSIAPQSGVGAHELSSLYARMLTGLVVCRSCVGNHSCCELQSAMALSCSETLLYSGSHFGGLAISPSCLPQWHLSLKRRGGGRDTSFMSKCYTEPLFSALWPVNYVLLGL